MRLSVKPSKKLHGMPGMQRAKRRKRYGEEVIKASPQLSKDIAKMMGAGRTIATHTVCTARPARESIVIDYVRIAAPTVAKA